MPKRNFKHIQMYHRGNSVSVRGINTLSKATSLSKVLLLPSEKVHSKTQTNKQTKKKKKKDVFVKHEHVPGPRSFFSLK